MSENNSLPSSETVKKRAMTMSIVMLVSCIFLLIVSQKTGWAAVAHILPYIDLAIGMVVGVSMGRSNSGWG